MRIEEQQRLLGTLTTGFENRADEIHGEGVVSSPLGQAKPTEAI